MVALPPEVQSISVILVQSRSLRARLRVLQTNVPVPEMAPDMTKAHLSKHHFQPIYERSLREPSCGFEAHGLFTTAPFDCPDCGAKVWVRLRAKSHTPIGCTCSRCTWIACYLVSAALPRAPIQTNLF